VDGLLGFRRIAVGQIDQWIGHGRSELRLHVMRL
jgi:hypothetical protein